MRSTIMTPIVFTVPACAVDVVLEFAIVRLPFLDVHDAFRVDREGGYPKFGGHKVLRQ